MDLNEIYTEQFRGPEGSKCPFSFVSQYHLQI